MRVGLVGQTEVAVVGRGVDRLLHRAQQHDVDLLRVGAVFGGVGDRLELRGRRLFGEREVQAQRFQVVGQRLALLRRRAFVHAVQRRVLVLRDEVGRANVGGQHRLFDHAVRVVARARNDLFDAAVVVADDLCFRGFELDGAALGALLQQRAKNFVQMDQVRHEFITPRRFRTPRVGQNRRHLGVGEARLRMHHRRVELIALDLAVGCDHHVADHAQAVHIRVQRAQAVGEFFRQHRDDAARKVNRSRALVGVFVERLAGAHIVADVGNRYQQTPARGLFRFAFAGRGHRLAVHRVVEVARVFAVDRHQRHVGQVDAVLQVGGAQLLRQRRGLRDRFRREAVRHFELAHRDFDFHARVVDLAEHLDDAAHRLREHRRRLGELDRHHLPGFGIGGGVLGDQDVLAVALVFGGDDPDAAFVQQAADQRRFAALDDLEHVAFGPALAVVAHDACAHAVAVQHRAHFLRRQIDVGHAGAFAQEETMAITVALHGAFHFAHQRGAERRGVLGCCVLDAKLSSFLRCPGGGIGRRTSFRY